MLGALILYFNWRLANRWLGVSGDVFPARMLQALLGVGGGIAAVVLLINRGGARRVYNVGLGLVAVVHPAAIFLFDAEVGVPGARIGAHAVLPVQSAAAQGSTVSHPRGDGVLEYVFPDCESAQVLREVVRTLGYDCRWCPSTRILSWADGGRTQRVLRRARDGRAGVARQQRNRQGVVLRKSAARTGLSPEIG